MRKQYHFRPSPRGLLAWDVDRLVDLARDLPVEWVALSAIRELDEAYWASDDGRPVTCRDIVEHARLMHECDLSYPVILSSDGRVMDGTASARRCSKVASGLRPCVFATTPRRIMSVSLQPTCRIERSRRKRPAVVAVLSALK